MMRVLMVCSSGGHLTQALALRPWWQQHERRWVTFPVEDARSRLADENVVECHYPTVRNLPNLVRNVGLAREVLRDFRPEVVVSTGAAIALPFFAQAKRYGAATVYIEPIDRIATPGLSGRLTYPFADEFLVQWPSLQGHYPGSRDVGMIL